MRTIVKWPHVQPGMDATYRVTMWEDNVYTVFFISTLRGGRA